MTAERARASLQTQPDIVVTGDAKLIAVSMPPERWFDVAQVVRDALGCAFFSFLTAIDWNDAGLEVVARVEHLDQTDGGFVVTMRTRLGPGVWWARLR